LNPKELFNNVAPEHWEQIYEELKQLYNLKDLIAPLEEQRIKEQQERTQANSSKTVR